MLTPRDYPLDHIAVAVYDLDIATLHYQEKLGSVILAQEEVPSQGVRVRFLEQDHFKIELLQALSESSPVARFLQTRGEGIHHIAYRSSDIYRDIQRLREEGLEILQESPVRGALGKWVFFIHPRSMGGTLIEICQPAFDGY